MVMPMAGRIVAAVIGGLLVLVAGSSVVGTLIVTRSVASRLTRGVDWIVDRAYQLATRNITNYKDRDRVLATQAAAILLLQLAVVAGGGLRRVRPAAVAVRRPRGGVRLRRCRVLAVHPGLRRPDRSGARGDRVPGRGDRPGDRHAADRLPADAVLGVQPQGDRGGAAERAGRFPVLGPGTAGADTLRAGIGHVDARYDARLCTQSGNAGLRTSPKATPPTCGWCGSAHPSRCRPG